MASTARLTDLFYHHQQDDGRRETYRDALVTTMQQLASGREKGTAEVRVPRLLGAFESWRILEPIRQARAKAVLEDLAAKQLSTDSYEIVTKTLGAG